MKSITISFDAISSEGRDVEVSLNKEIANGLLVERGEKSVKFDDAINASVNLKRNGGKINAVGTIKTVVTYDCVRCIEKFQAPFSAEFSATLAGEGGAQVNPHAEVELVGADLDVIQCPGDVVDLTGLIMEETLLAMDQYPLCGEGCKGICPECGTNLNSGACRCQKKAIDPRLSVLLKLKKN